MALDRTSGFDMLVQISETELNDQLATAFVAGGLIPPSMSLPVKMSAAWPGPRTSCSVRRSRTSIGLGREWA
jgi:hypothetical protein